MILITWDKQIENREKALQNLAKGSVAPKAVRLDHYRVKSPYESKVRVINRYRTEESLKKSYLKRSNTNNKKQEHSIMFTKGYENVTQEEIDLRIEFGKLLLSKYYDLSRKFLTFKVKKQSQKFIGRAEVYEVYVGKDYLGKLAITFQNGLANKTMFYTYSIPTIAKQQGRVAAANKQTFKSRNYK